MENLQADSFARDYHIHAELAAEERRHHDRRCGSRRSPTTATRTRPPTPPSSPPACSTSHRLLRLEGGIRRGRRGLHEQAAGRRRLPLLVPRDRGGAHHRALADIWPPEIGMDPADFRMKNFIQQDQFPYNSAPRAGSTTAATTTGALQKALDQIGYADLRKEQAEKRARGELMGIGILVHGDRRRGPVASTSTSSASRCSTRPSSGSTRRARPSALRHPSRRARATRPRTRRSWPRSSGIPADESRSRRATPTRRPTGSAPTPARSTPVAGAATAIAVAQDQGEGAPDRGAPARVLADDLEWTPGKFTVKGSPDRSRRSQELAFAAYTNHPPGWRPGLEAVDYYDPPNLTFPFGSYICVVDIDKGTGEVKVRRFVAVDDCGNIINPMIVDGQIHGGLTMGLAPSLYEEISYDEQGNILAGTFMDYLLPTAMETPSWETGKTITPVAAPPAGREGRGRVGDRRRPAGHRQRRRRRAVAPGRPPRRHPDHAPEGLADPARQGRGRSPMPRTEPVPLAPRSSSRPAGCSRSPRSSRSAADLGQAGAHGHRPSRRHHRGLGRRRLRPAGRRPRGAALAPRRPSAAPAAVEGRRRRRAGEATASSSSSMTCHSGGTLEIYVEPHLPAPSLWLAGTTPIVGALGHPRRRRPAGGCRCSTRSPMPTPFPTQSACRR